jgi:sulfur carrier protein
MEPPSTIYLNGAPEPLEGTLTLRNLTERLGLDPRHVAVEVNLELVPRESHAQHCLRNGDRVEIVTLVGGG